MKQADDFGGLFGGEVGGEAKDAGGQGFGGRAVGGIIMIDLWVLCAGVE